MRINIQERVLHFKQPAGTSRGVYTERRSWFLQVFDGERQGLGECAPLPQLSCDDLPNYTMVLRHFCNQVVKTGQIDFEAMRPYPSMLFGMETALQSLASGGSRLFDTPFCRSEMGIPINGLVWMGTFTEMQQRIEQKLEQGFHCIKLKIGAIDFDDELELIKQIRRRFSHREVELRVDANGAFSFDHGDALYKLELLSQYALHSIEQPIPPAYSPRAHGGGWASMAELCRDAPLPIALDEELIGVNSPDAKRQLLNIIKPAYIVLKPSLHGGMMGCREWIELARDMGIGWWITSALESNVGLNAIAQFCSTQFPERGGTIMPQGLGTGQLFTDNIDMPLEIRGDKLWYIEP